MCRPLFTCAPVVRCSSSCVGQKAHGIVKCIGDRGRTVSCRMRVRPANGRFASGYATPPPGYDSLLLVPMHHAHPYSFLWARQAGQNLDTIARSSVTHDSGQRRAQRRKGQPREMKARIRVITLGHTPQEFSVWPIGRRRGASRTTSDPISRLRQIISGLAQIITIQRYCFPLLTAIHG